jgi:hypothetical protein
MSDGIVPLTPEQIAAQEAQAGKNGYIKRNLIALDMEASVVMDGNPDETISSRLARDAEKGMEIGILGSKILDVFEKDHGAKAQAGDVERAVIVIALETKSPGLGGK